MSSEEILFENGVYFNGKIRVLSCQFEMAMGWDRPDLQGLNLNEMAMGCFASY